MTNIASEVMTVKSRHHSARIILGALMVVLAATEVGAQNGTNTQRPLRPGQTRGAKFMVPVFKSNERGLGVEMSDVLRDRMMSDYLATTMWLIPRNDIHGQLQASGYSVTEALAPNDLRMLAMTVQAEEYVDGTVTRLPDGTLSVKANLLIPRPEGMVQPLPEVTGNRPGDVAGKLSDEIERARKQFPHVTRCVDAARQNNAAAAMEAAQRAMREYPNSIPARVCILDIVAAAKNTDSVITVAEEILAAYPEHERALRRVAEAYFEKKDEDKYVQTVTKLVALNPNDVALAEQVVNMLGQARRPEVAKPIIDQMVESNPGDPALIRLQWKIYTAMKDWKGAIQVGENMIKADTAAADTTFWHALVAAYVADSQPQKAQEAASRGAAKFPNVPSLWISVAHLARQNGQLPQALEAVNRAIAIDPKFPGAQLQKAAIFQEQNQIDSLMTTMRQVAANGGDTVTAAGMLLSKGNQMLQAYQKDSLKTVEQGDTLIAVLALSDTLNATNNAKFLRGVAQVLVGQALLTRASESKSCDDARRANDLLIDAQTIIGQYGRDFAQAAASVMQGVMQLQPYADQSVKALCRSGP